MLILCLSFAVAVLDQLTKHLIRQDMVVGSRIPVIPGFFDISYVRNTGAAWGMLSGLGGWLVAVSVIMLIVIVFFRRTFMTDSLVDRVAVGFIIAGIVGNLIDRLRLGYVVDFLDFYVGRHHFPAFNVADSAICTGVGLCILTQAIAEIRERRKQSSDLPT